MVNIVISWLALIVIVLGATSFALFIFGDLARRQAWASMLGLIGAFVTGLLCWLLVIILISRSFQ